MSAIDYLLLGHMTADLTPQGRQIGGTVSYAAPVAQAIGHRVGIVTSTAHAEPLLAQLHAYAQVHVKPSATTTTFENIYAPDGTRTQVIHSVAAPLTWDDVPTTWQDAPFVHFAPLADELAWDMVHRFPHATKLLTLQGCLREWDERGHVSPRWWLDVAVLQAVNIVIFSQQDVATIPYITPELIRYSQHVIITDSANGGVYYHNGQAMPYAAFPVREVSPTGAGDVFATALLALLPHTQHHIHRAITGAAYLAAQSVTRTGIEHSVTPKDIETALTYCKE